MSKYTLIGASLALFAAITTSSLHAGDAPAKQNSMPAPTQEQLGSAEAIPDADPEVKSVQIYCLLQGTQTVQYVTANMHFCKKHGNIFWTHSYPCLTSAADAIAACKTLGPNYLSQFNTAAAQTICNSISGRNQGDANGQFLTLAGLCISQ